jgi:hypothetical protein
MLNTRTRDLMAETRDLKMGNYNKVRIFLLTT